MGWVTLTFPWSLRRTFFHSYEFPSKRSDVVDIMHRAMAVDSWGWSNTDEVACWRWQWVAVAGYWRLDIEIRLPYVKVGGLPPGRCLFRLAADSPGAVGGVVLRWPADSMGWPCWLVPGTYWRAFTCCVPGTGVLEWGRRVPRVEASGDVMGAGWLGSLVNCWALQRWV